MNLKGGWSHSRKWITIHHSGNCLRDLIKVLVFLKFYWVQHAANIHDLASDLGSRDSHDLVRNLQSRVKPKYNGRSGTNEFGSRKAVLVQIPKYFSSTGDTPVPLIVVGTGGARAQWCWWHLSFDSRNVSPLPNF